MEYVQILKCSSELGNCCSDPAMIYLLDTLRRIFGLIQIIAPILLILMATITFFRLTMNPETKNGVKQVKNLFIAAVMIFFIPVLMDVILGLMPETFSVSACWDQAKTMAESYRNNNYEYRSWGDTKSPSPIIIDPGKYDGSNPAKDGGMSAQGILEGAKEVHKKYESEKWVYYTHNGGLSTLRWNDIKYSTYNPSKSTCCATFVGSAFYVGGVFTEEEINKYNYNSQLGIDELCKDHNWTKITSYSQLAAGDVVIMTSSDSGGAPGHVQIYAGDGTWYNAGSTEAIQRTNPYASDASSRFLWAWRKP